MTFALDSRYPVSRHLAAAVLLAAALAGCSSGSGGGGGGGACTLPQAASLSVAEFTPPNSATGVFVATNVSVRFNTCLDTSSLTSTSFLVSGPGGFVAGSVTYDAATATLTLDPAASLATSTLYIVGVTGLRGARGETMTAPAGASFRTQGAPEYVAPATTASPPGGRYHTAQSVTLTCVDNPGGTGCAATYYTVDGSTPTAGSTRYTAPVTVAQSLTLRFFSVDVQGNAETPKQQAYVIDTVPPTLTGSNPPDGATEVPVIQVLSATFSEPMDVATLSPATVTVDNGVAATLAYASATNTLVITPTERLACNTTYRVSIGAGATDIAGNALVQPATFGFTTATDCEEPVTTASVAGGVYITAQGVTLTCTDAGGSGCGRIVYTTDGSVPSLDPPAHGTIVTTPSAGPIAIGEGDTVLRYYSEDAAGNREVLRQQIYSVSAGKGFTFVATDGGLARGVGQVPASFVPIRPGGRTYAFFRDASNGRLYRGTERGLLISDGGEAWTFVPASLPPVISIFAQGSRVFAGTGGGLLVSTDGGATFAARNLGAGGAGYVRAIVAQNSNVYAATDSGLAVSADRGRTFAMRTTASGLGSNSVRDLVLAGSTLYAATSAGVSISTDGGATFVNRAAGLASPSVNAIAVLGSTVYAGTDGGLCVSTDGGATYVVKATAATGLGSDYVGELVLAGTTLYMGTGLPYLSATARPLAISTDGGAHFTFPLVSPSTDPTLPIDSIFVEGATVRVGAYPAYYLSANAGATFVPKDLFGSLTRVTGSGASLYLAIQGGAGHGGVAVSGDQGQSFTIRGLEDGLKSNMVDDLFASGSNVYAATFNGVGFSTNGGTTFVTHDLSTTSDAGCVYASGTTVWAGAGLALEKSVGGGAFASVQAGTGGGVGIAVSGGNFYLASSNGLWVSNSNGANGSFTLKGAAQGLGNTFLSGVAVDSAGKVLAVSNSSGGPTGFYLSADNGASFTPLPGAAMFPYGIYAHGTTWYASTYNGLAIAQDGGTTWTWRGTAEGLPGAPKAAWYMPF